MPYQKKNIFNRKNLNYLLSKIDKASISDLQNKQAIINDWIGYIQSGNIGLTKETALQGKFLDDIFSGVLGYKSRIKNTDQWNLNQEQLTIIDSKFADGSLGFFSKDKTDVRVVIELKGANIGLDEKQHRHNDTRTPIEQAFSYQNKIGSKCKWVIVSNFREIRLYHHSSSTEYEVFNIVDLDNWEQFRSFYYLLSVGNLLSNTGESVIDSLYARNEAEEVNISKQFYFDFKQTRSKLFEHLKENNPTKSELLLLEKTQKFLDRFIFVCFCEDNRLLPEKTFRNVISTSKKSYSFSETKIWNELKGLFHAINIGSPPHNINKFNGGLFSTDTDLDELIIKDNILEDIAKLTEYDFETDVDVNILGHIFEQSISDIEEIKAGIEGKEFDKKTSKRKKDGIYYTPEYITKYIVENAVGGWLEDRKKKLGFYDLPELNPTPALPTGEGERTDAEVRYKKGEVPRSEYITSDPIQWHNVKEFARENKKNPTQAEKILWEHLKDKKIGFKFRRQHSIGQYIVDFICLEKRLVIELDGDIHENTKEYDSERTKYISSFGIEVIRFKNEEIIQNTNKVIDQILQRLGSYLPSPVGRARVGSIKKHLAFWLAYKERLMDIKILDPACGSGAFLNQAFNFLYAEGQFVNDKIAELSGGQGELFELDKHILSNNLFGVDLNNESVEITKLSLWIKTANRNSELTSLDKNIKCGNSLIDDPEVAVDKAFDWVKEFPDIFPGYRDYSYKKTSPEEELEQRRRNYPDWQEIKERNLQEPSYSYKPGSKGFDKHGFDVIIGNPPYLNMTINNIDKSLLSYYINKYQSVKKSNSKNLFTLFIEKGINLLKSDSYLSFIIPEGLFQTRSYKECVDYMNVSGIISNITYFEDWVFEDAITGNIIFVFNKSKKNTTKSEYIFSKGHNLSVKSIEKDTVIEKFNNNYPILNEIAILFKGMVVKDRNNVLTDTKKNDTNDIFLLGNCIDRYLVTNKFYCSYNQLTIIGGTKLKSKYDIAPRILIRRTGNTLCCSFIENKALTESTLYSCYSKDTDKFSDKYILCLLNSKLYTYYVKKLMVTNQQAFPQILMTDLEQLPIPYLGNQQLYIDLADIMLEKNKDLQQTREAFLEFITGQFVIAKPSIKLQYWFNLSFEEFIKELEKGKVKLPSTQKFDLKPLFDREQAKAVGIKIIINDTDKKIDSMVYELYGLTDEEIKIVEGK